MYKYILKNKLIFLSIATALVLYTLLKCQKHQTRQEEKIITMEPINSVVGMSKILDTKVITNQINASLDDDSKNFLIDNSVIDGKIELPEVAYTDPAIADLLVSVIDEQNEESLEKYKEGSVVFNQTLAEHPSNKDCYKYTCMPGAYTQCTNNVYCNSNKKCECRAVPVCRSL
jgi:hypothetical protein